MAKTKRPDEITKRANAMLYFKHMDRISERVCAGDMRGYSIMVKHAKTIVSPWLDDDNNFLTEMEAISEAYSDSNRPEGTRRDEWRMEQREEELEAIHRNACREGVFYEFRVEMEEEPL